MDVLTDEVSLFHGRSDEGVGVGCEAGFGELQITGSELLLY